MNGNRNEEIKNEGRGMKIDMASVSVINGVYGLSLDFSNCLERAAMVL